MNLEVHDLYPVREDRDRALQQGVLGESMESYIGV